MWEISSAVRVAVRHQIRGVAGEGGRVHEHRWRVRAVVRASELDRTGWVLDFGVLAAELRAVLAPYDGVFMNDVPPFGDVNPTRENVARYIADSLAARVEDERVRVHALEIWEEDVCCATYVRDGA
jgi:6-pyruvoyltetrahydropterin/6-carboxytetrahydropterin synthase